MRFQPVAEAADHSPFRRYCQQRPPIARIGRTGGRRIPNLADIVANVTRAKGRKTLYHFTRASNLPAIAERDALRSSARLLPAEAGRRREAPTMVRMGAHEVTLNAHLRIPDAMLREGCSQEAFRESLDRHVFFWPTIRDCRVMWEMYGRREQEETFAVLALDAHSLLAAHAAKVKLSKYDSGSAPRFPHRCRYRKSPDLFLTLADFGRVREGPVPLKPSDIREILVEEEVAPLSAFLQAVYVTPATSAPARWLELSRPAEALFASVR